MYPVKSFIIAFGIVLSISSCNQQTPPPTEKPAEHKAPRAAITNADEAIAELKDGNKRFLDGKMINTDYKEQMAATKDGQHPHTAILSCLDSRVPPEIIFDQGFGNLFIARVAGNIEDPYILGSLEYAVGVVGSKVIVVLGHESCGAVKGSIDKAQLGNLTGLLEHIQPAITGDTTDKAKMLDATIRNNVKVTMTHIMEKSTVIAGLIKEGKIKMVGAYYSLATGKVEFMD